MSSKTYKKFFKIATVQPQFKTFQILSVQIQNNTATNMGNGLYLPEVSSNRIN